MTKRTPHKGFRMDEKWRSFVTCPTCGKEFEIVDQRYWERRWKGEDVAPRTKVFCTNACRQRAYRARRAPHRNA